MPFRVVSRVGRGIGVLNEGDSQTERGSFGVNFGRAMVTNGDGNALFLNYLGKDFLKIFGTTTVIILRLTDRRERELTEIVVLRRRRRRSRPSPPPPAAAESS